MASSSSSPIPKSAAAPSPSKAPAGMPFGKEDPKRRQQLLVAGIGGVALVVAAVLLFVFRPWQSGAPAGGEPAKLGKYTATEDFRKLPFERREVYMRMLDKNKDQLSKAYADGTLSLEDYQKSMIAARLGDDLDDMRKYFAKPAGDERTKYLDKLLTKKDAKADAIKHNAAARDEKKERDALKDDAAEDAEVATWPADIQGQYKQFKTALSERKKLRKAAKAPKTATAPATGATP